MKLMRFHRPEVWNWPATDQITTLRDEINRLFESPLAAWGQNSEVFNAWAPAVDLYENRDHLIATVELPGLKREDIDISLHEGTLTIAGERKLEKKPGEGETTRSERYFGRFQRTLTLPKPVDANQVTAAYKDGVLTVTLPKAEAAKPTQIAVNAN